MTGPTLRVHAPAKLNLTLAVGPPDRSDHGRGRHPVASLMVALDFGDTVTVRFLPPGEPSRWNIRYADDAPRPEPIDWPLADDLAFRAHALAETAADRAIPVDATIAKRVPTGAGLGGGSADAAAVLHAIQQHLAAQHPATPFDPVPLAHQLGADVAFALHAIRRPDQPLALATGFGEILQPRPLPRTLHAALLLPPFRCPTAQTYAAFDQTPEAPATHTWHTPTATQQALARLQDTKQPWTTARLFNDLTPAAQAAQTQLTPLIEQLRQAGLQPQLTGSGSALFLAARDHDHAAELAARCHQLTGHPALPVRTVNPNEAH